MEQLKILITEDEQVQALLLQRQIKALGHQVVGIVSSGEEALERLQDLQPDLVMMDINLAGELNGIETAELIQKNQDLPIIFVTSAEDKGTIDKALASNAGGYLFKPVENKRDVSLSIDLAMTKNAYDRKLRQLNKELDDKVRLRTNELEEANKKLKKALDRERELNEFKSTIILNVSHQFKTPLTAIHSSAELIERNLNQTANIERAIIHTKRILDSAENLNALITELLYVEGDRQKNEIFNLESVNLNNYLQKFIEEIEHGIGKNHKIKSKIELDKSIVLMDKQHFHQIVSNLMANAVNYSESGKTVSLHIKLKEGKLSGEVRDQGIGIPDKDQGHLFTRFFRASNVSYRQGTGIGLSIVKKALDLIGGTLDFKSIEGKGTTFYFTMPIRYAN
jgi:signal transduction histidine kinase